MLKTTTATELFSYIKSGSPGLLHTDFILMHGGCKYICEFMNTLEGENVKQYSSLWVRPLTYGGGQTEVSVCDDCSHMSKRSCTKFRCHELYSPDAICDLAKKREDAYLILCQKFNFSNQVIRCIEEYNESNSVRLGDALHHLYHKDHSITWEQVNKIVSDG